MADITFKPLGDSAMLVCFKNEINIDINKRVHALYCQLVAADMVGIKNITFSYCDLCVYYDFALISFSALQERISAILAEMDSGAAQSFEHGKQLEIPVIYGGEYGPDLPYVAEHLGLTEQEVVRLHSSALYRVYGIGFMPGLPYLGGLPEALYLPRRAEVIPVMKAGSITIAAGQAACHTISSPSGWWSLGWTPYRLLDMACDPPVIIEAGDSITFKPIQANELDEYLQKGQDIWQSRY